MISERGGSIVLTGPAGEVKTDDVLMLDAADASRAIGVGASSTVDRISAGHQEINAACNGLSGQGGPSCRCSAGYKP